MTNVILYLFIKYIKKSLQNPPPHKINPLKSVQSVAKTFAQHSATNPKTHHHTITIPSVNHPSVRVFFVQSNGTKNVSRTKQKNKLP